MTGLGQVIELVLRLALVTVFLLAAAGKAVSVPAVGEMIRDLLPLSRLAARTAAVAVIGAEAALAVALAAAGRGAAGVVAAAVLAACAVFAAASLLALRHGGGIACRCFGSLGAGSVLGGRTLARAGLLAAAALAWFEALRRAGPSVGAAGPRVALCFAVAGAAAMALAWRRLLPGRAHRRFAAYGIEQETLAMVAPGGPQPVEIEYGRSFDVSDEGRELR